MTNQALTLMEEPYIRLRRNNQLSLLQSLKHRRYLKVYKS